MSDVAASDFRHPRRHVRLDTILRLRWLAVLGPALIAAIGTLLCAAEISVVAVSASA